MADEPNPQPFGEHVRRVLLERRARQTPALSPAQRQQRQERAEREQAERRDAEATSEEPGA
jgi:hypothetical protein